MELRRGAAAETHRPVVAIELAAVNVRAALQVRLWQARGLNSEVRGARPASTDGQARGPARAPARAKIAVSASGGEERRAERAGTNGRRSVSFCR